MLSISALQAQHAKEALLGKSHEAAESAREAAEEANEKVRDLQFHRQATSLASLRWFACHLRPWADAIGETGAVEGLLQQMSACCHESTRGALLIPSLSPVPQAREMRDSAADTARGTKDDVVERTRRAADTVAEKAQGAKETIGGAAERASDKARRKALSVQIGPVAISAVLCPRFIPLALTAGTAVESAPIKTLAPGKTPLGSSWLLPRPQAREVRDSAADKARETKESLSERAEAAREYAGDKAKGAKDTLGDAATRVSEKARRRCCAAARLLLQSPPGLWCPSCHQRRLLCCSQQRSCILCRRLISLLFCRRATRRIPSWSPLWARRTMRRTRPAARQTRSRTRRGARRTTWPRRRRGPRRRLRARRRVCWGTGLTRPRIRATPSPTKRTI